MDPNRDSLSKYDPDIFFALKGEERRQRYGLELIPSENFAYPEVLSLLGSAFTNKYSEGYPGRRYYGGQEFTDIVEELARDRAKKVFRAEHANVQPLSGSPMNQAIFHSFLNPDEKVLSMDLSHGGHLTHGAPVSHMGKIYNFIRYKTLSEKNGELDWNQIRELAHLHKPKIILCGHSSYPKDIDYKLFKDIADEVGALTMADVSHTGGWIAANLLNNPMDVGFDFMTTTTHKSMRGPRGGMILCKKEHAKVIDSSVFPGLQGGPHMNQVAATAVTMKKISSGEFIDYARQVLKNAKVLSDNLRRKGIDLITGGTENHLMVLNTISSVNLNGKEAEFILDKVNITTNKQVIPDDPRPPLSPSGVRVGTPAITTRGMVESNMTQISDWIVKALKNYNNDSSLTKIKAEVQDFCAKFQLPGIHKDI